MHHRVRLDLTQHTANRRGIGYIQLDIRHSGHSGAILCAAVLRRDVAADALVSAFVQFIHHVVAKLTAYAGNKYSHLTLLNIQLISPSGSRCAAISNSASCGARALYFQIMIIRPSILALANASISSCGTVCCR